MYVLRNPFAFQIPRGAFKQKHRCILVQIVSIYLSTCIPTKTVFKTNTHTCSYLHTHHSLFRDGNATYRFRSRIEFLKHYKENGIKNIPSILLNKNNVLFNGTCVYKLKCCTVVVSNKTQPSIISIAHHKVYAKFL